MVIQETITHCSLNHWDQIYHSHSCHYSLAKSSHHLLIPLLSSVTIFLAKNNTLFHSQTKHIDIQYHYIYEIVKNHKIKIIHISSDDNLADILTKPLPWAKFKPFCGTLGIQGYQAWESVSWLLQAC